MGITARINHVRTIRPKKDMGKFKKLVYIKTNWLIVSLWLLDKLVMLGLFLWAK